MGATSAYLLPWPELPELADGPDGFQDLALATENAIKNNTGGLVKSWGNYASNNQIITAGSPMDVDFGVVNFPTPARTVIIAYSFTIDVGEGGMHDLYGYFDGQQVLYQRVEHTWADGRTHDRSYFWTTAIKNIGAGNHTVKARAWPAGGCLISNKMLICNIVALG